MIGFLPPPGGPIAANNCRSVKVSLLVSFLSYLYHTVQYKIICTLDKCKEVNINVLKAIAYGGKGFFCHFWAFFGSHYLS